MLKNDQHFVADIVEICSIFYLRVSQGTGSVVTRSRWDGHFTMHTHVR